MALDRRACCGALITLLALLLLAAAPARAVTLRDIPPDLKARLPEFLLSVLPARALAALSLADLEEYADAYSTGELHFVNEVRCEDCSGSITPEQAQLILQIPPGAPFIPARFVRMAKQAYSIGIFSALQWEQFDNADGSVDIHLHYSSRSGKAFVPEASYLAVPGYLAGASYRDYYYGKKDRTLIGGFQLSENFTDEPRLYGSYRDNTLSHGKEFFSVGASVGDDWRRKLQGTPQEARFRDRIARVDTAFGQRRALDLGNIDADVSVLAGAYGQDHFVLHGDPTQGGTQPRSDIEQDGEAVYVGIGIDSSKKDQIFATRQGHSLSVRAEKHMGDFDFERISLDARRYIPAANLLGLKPDEIDENGGVNDLDRMYPTATVAIQTQVILADGDVPFSEEILPASGDFVRGYPRDRYSGTKAFAARAEYRMSLDKARRYDAFAYTEHVFFGEELGDLENISTYGVGVLLKLPIYGGLQGGAQYTRTMDNSEGGLSFILGYSF